MDQSLPYNNFPAKQGKQKLVSPIPFKDILEGKTLRFTFGPPESDNEEDYFSDEEPLGCKIYLEEHEAELEYDLRKLGPDFSNLGNSAWVELHDEALIKKQIIKKGRAVVPSNVKVYFTYIGYVEGDTNPFDVAHALKPKASFLDGDLLPGLAIGIQSMRLGEVARIFVPPRFAYGELGCPTRIPGGASIIFHVHLKQFIPREKFQNPIFMKEDEFQDVNFREVLKAVQRFNEQGNDLLRAKDFHKAIKKYKQAIYLLETRFTITEKEHLDREKMLGTLYLNRCGTFLELKEPRKAIRDGEKYMTLENSPRKCKALYRIAKAHLELGNFDEAYKFCKRSSDDATNHETKDVNLCFELRRKINRAVLEHKTNYRSLCKRMLGVKAN